MISFAPSKTVFKKFAPLSTAFIAALIFCFLGLPGAALADKAAAGMYEKAIEQNKKLSAATVASVFEMEIFKGESGRFWQRFEKTAASRIKSGKTVEMEQVQINPSYETVFGEKQQGFSVDCSAWDQSHTYHWYYNPSDPQTPREMVQDSAGRWLYFLPLGISQDRVESNDNTLKFVEKFGEIRGDTIVLVSEGSVMIDGYLVSNLTGVITFDKKGRVASFEASGNVPVPEFENESYFTYNRQLIYDFAPRPLVFSDVGVINGIAARDRAEGFYKALAPEGAALPYSCELPPLPSPLAEMNLEVTFSGKVGERKAGYTIKQVETLTPQARPGYFLADAAQSIEKFDTHYNYIRIGEQTYNCAPDIMVLVWDESSGRWALLPKNGEGIEDLGKFYCVVNDPGQLAILIQQHDKYMP